MVKPLNGCLYGRGSLHVGTIFIAILEVVPFIVLLYYNAKAVADTDEIKSEIQKEYRKRIFWFKLKLNRESWDTDDVVTVDSYAELVITLNLIYKVTVCIIPVLIIWGILLIAGSFKEKLGMMIPWIGVQMICLVASPILFIYALIEFDLPNYISRGALRGIIGGVFWLQLYFLLIVLSRFEEIRESKAKRSDDQEKVYRVQYGVYRVE